RVGALAARPANTRSRDAAPARPDLWLFRGDGLVRTRGYRGELLARQARDQRARTNPRSRARAPIRVGGATHRGRRPGVGRPWPERRSHQRSFLTRRGVSTMRFLGDEGFESEAAGRKAANLHELIRLGVRVPPGFVISSDDDPAAVSDGALLDAL